MKCSVISSRSSVAMTVMLLLLGLCPAATLAKSPVEIKNYQVMVDQFTTGETSHFIMSGAASHLGQFTAYGEVDFVPGEEEGSLVGEGVVAFTAANGDLLVGVVEWQAGPQTDDGSRRNDIHFSWRDSIEFSDGRTIQSTGRFVDDRPPGVTKCICLKYATVCDPVCVSSGGAVYCWAYCHTACVGDVICGSGVSTGGN